MFEINKNIKFIKHYFLLPGELYASKECTQVITVLGSCVAICLFDITTGIGGINHYMLPYIGNNVEDKLKYGDYSINLLLKKMHKLGAKNSNIKAKIFGGASQFNMQTETINVGEKNIDVAHKMLDKYNIKIVREDVGGSIGRKIIFYSKLGKVFHKRLLKNNYPNSLARVS